jgi:parvulin-like peptidyl-prolyl isomerase
MKRTFILIFSLFFAAITGFAQSDLQPAATVNLIRTEVITVRQFRTEVERMEKATGRTLAQNERQQVLDVMINERLAVQAAERDRITVTDNEVNQQMQQFRNNIAETIGRQPTEAEFTQAVRNESGLDVQAFREQVRRQMIVQKFLMAKKEDNFKSIRVPTENEIVNQFNLARTQFVRPETVRFSMIQVPYGTDAAARTRAKDMADRFVREIGSSASKFDEVVARGQSPNSGYQAGDAGFLPRTMEAASVVGQDLIETAFSLKQGEVSKLIEGGPGYQIIKVTESYTMKSLELDDILRLGTRITVRDHIGNTLLEYRQQEVLQQATEELVTELRTGRPYRVFEENIR